MRDFLSSDAPASQTRRTSIRRLTPAELLARLFASWVILRRTIDGRLFFRAWDEENRRLVLAIDPSRHSLIA